MSRTSPLAPGLAAYVGDLHNHCGISYGHGPIEDAYANARLQLDFGTVTGHAWWPDMPTDDRLEPLRRYHLEGFARLAACWDHVQDVTEQVHTDGEFVSFLSWEWHSMTYGDHCVYFNGPRGEVVRAPTLPDLKEALARLGHRQAMVLPHHVGYLQGRRGANWDAFTPELTPLVEVVSMHGCAMTDEGPRPYLHTMGPVDGRSMVGAGLGRGHRFGIIGSTDHHSAHPGSHGYGRAMVWAERLDRPSVWGALWDRRTYAVTGDPIVVATSVDGAPMGSEAESGTRRRIEVDVTGLEIVDLVEVSRNGVVVEQARAGGWSAGGTFRGVLGVTVGWGELGVTRDWDVAVRLEGGRIDAVEPRLHGFDVVAPSATLPDTYHVSAWRRVDARTVTLTTRTAGNPTVTSDATQGLALVVEATSDARLVVTDHGTPIASATLTELLGGSRTGYTGGFVSGAVKLHRAIPDAARRVEMSFTDPGSGESVDRYEVHVRQRNEQHAWTSPTWVSRR